MDCNMPCTAAKTTNYSSLLHPIVASPPQSQASPSLASAKSHAIARSSFRRPMANPTPFSRAAGNTSPDKGCAVGAHPLPLMAEGGMHVRVPQVRAPNQLPVTSYQSPFLERHVHPSQPAPPTAVYNPPHEPRSEE